MTQASVTIVYLAVAAASTLNAEWARYACLGLLLGYLPLGVWRSCAPLGGGSRAATLTLAALGTLPPLALVALGGNGCYAAILGGAFACFCAGAAVLSACGYRKTARGFVAGLAGLVLLGALLPNVCFQDVPVWRGIVAVTTADVLPTRLLSTVWPRGLTCAAARLLALAAGALLLALAAIAISWRVMGKTNRRSFVHMARGARPSLLFWLFFALPVAALVYFNRVPSGAAALGMAILALPDGQFRLEERISGPYLACVCLLTGALELTPQSLPAALLPVWAAGLSFVPYLDKKQARRALVAVATLLLAALSHFLPGMAYLPLAAACFALLVALLREGLYATYLPLRAWLLS